MLFPSWPPRSAFRLLCRGYSAGHNEIEAASAARLIGAFTCDPAIAAFRQFQIMLSQRQLISEQLHDFSN